MDAKRGGKGVCLPFGQNDVTCGNFQGKCHKMGFEIKKPQEKKTNRKETLSITAKKKKTES